MSNDPPWLPPFGAIQEAAMRRASGGEIASGPVPAHVEFWSMDGMRHERGGADCGCYDRCECGALLHSQGVYGGAIYVCEGCDQRRP